MEHIVVGETLSIKKLEPDNVKDCWIMRELDKDVSIGGDDGYLWPLNEIFDNIHYLATPSLYNAPYAIYKEKNPIGFLEISDILGYQMSVYLCYALLKEARGYGYMTQVLRNITKIILTDDLNDIKKVRLTIQPQNFASQATALRAGYVEDGFTKEEHELQGFIGYQKNKVLLLKEESLSYRTYRKRTF